MNRVSTVLIVKEKVDTLDSHDERIRQDYRHEPDNRHTTEQITNNFVSVNLFAIHPLRQPWILDD